MDNYISLPSAPLIASFITGVLGPMIVIYVRYLVRKKNIQLNAKQKEFNFIVKNQNIINDTLNSLQEKYSIDRLWVCQFHNGGNFWPGNQSMKKLSVVFESTAPNISADIMKMQNIPVSFFSGLIQKMMSEHNYIALNISDIKDNALRYYWESRGVALVYLYPIYCYDNMLVGLLGVEQTNKHTLSKVVCEEIFDEAKTLSGYIANVVVKDTYN
jgi:hypothetical protein